MFERRDTLDTNYQLAYEYIAEVVDIQDPEYRGRLKCNISGITEGVTEENLPWCETQGNLFGSDNSVVGFSSVPKVGSYVYVKFLYGNPSSPVVSGYARGSKDSSNVHKVLNLGESIYNTRNTNLIGPELAPLNTSTEYGKNNVIETNTAVIEIDDTSGNERISIQHKNGSFFEIRPDGVIQVKSNSSEYHIVKGSLEEYIANCVNRVILGDKTELINGFFQLTAEGNLEIVNDVKITGNLQVTEEVTVDSNISTKAELSDKQGNLTSLRDIYEVHTHVQGNGNDAGGGGVTTPPIQSDPRARWGDYTWSSTPLGCSYVPEAIIPAYEDSPEPYYTSNIQTVNNSDVPESYPANNEQDEKTEQQVEASTPDCADLTQRNPFEEAETLMNFGSAAWQETGSNPNITVLWDEIGYNGANFADETAWCAVFVSAVLKRTGNKYLKTASSQAYKNYGEEVSIGEAEVGDIVVFYRKGSNSGLGHLGFFAGSYTDTHIAVLGGNQSNNLNIRYFRRNNPSKGWGIRTIRRAVACIDGETTPPSYSYTIPSNIYDGGKVT